MADVYVNTWAEFLDAIAVEGNTVICPSQAIWDMNEIEPEGVTTLPAINCTAIQGNDTTIKNLHTTAAFLAYPAVFDSVDALHFENFIAEGDGLFHMSSPTQGGGTTRFSRCRFSGLCGTNTRAVIRPGSGTWGDNYGNASAYRCSFMIDAQTSSGFWAVGASAKYSRFHIAVPNGVFTMPGTLQWCYVRADTPLQQGICPAGTLACVFDGNMQNVTQAQEPDHTFISVFNKSSMPNLEESEYLKGVTTEQLLNADYLYSIGFPIGVDPEDVD